MRKPWEAADINSGAFDCSTAKKYKYLAKANL
jgi:hypothetical protein